MGWVPLRTPLPQAHSLGLTSLLKHLSEVLHERHSLLTALRALGLHPDPGVGGQNAQELLQHQQLQHLLLGVHLRPQPLAAELPELGQRLALLSEAWGCVGEG